MTVPTEMEVTGIRPGMKFFAVAGGSAGDFTITGIKVGDSLMSVMGFILVEGGPNALTILNLTSEFTITADGTINNDGGTTSAAGMLFVVYADNPNA